jgi:succinate dehydrogenase / fumarate reductase cytochrome b subunit
MSAFSCSPCAFVKSSIGRKIIVALTGLALVLFFAGEEAFNDYAEFLHSFLHGAGVWIARLGLLACFFVHIWFTVLLTKENKAARPKYAHNATVQAPKSSRIMIWSGLTIIAFVIFHILHFTVRTDAELATIGEISPWEMVIVGFQNPLVVIFYLISMTLLCSHLSHGVGSIFQTLGLRSKKTAGPIKFISKAYAAVIYLGFISIPIAILVFGFGQGK